MGRTYSVLDRLVRGSQTDVMGMLLKFVIFAVAGYVAWSTVRRWFGVLRGPGGVPPMTSRRTPASPSPDAGPAARSPAQGPIVEETRQCRVCGAYVSVSAGKCGRPDCP
jgi:hypothetical protein